MSMDFLGLSETNIIVAEEATVEDNMIIPLRGFFFSDTVTVYDKSGEPIDENGFNFDLPIPDISARIGRMVFGRILVNSRVDIGSIDYTALYSEDDNRYDDILRYVKSSAKTASTDYYSHISGIFKSGINEMEGSEIGPWLTALDELIAVWRERNIDHEMMIDFVDEVFTKGVVRYPQQFNFEEYQSSSFVTIGERGNTINLSKWDVEWIINDNIFTIDYGAMRLDMIHPLTSLRGAMVNKYSGNIDHLEGVVDSASGNRVPEAKPVMSMGISMDNDIYLSDGNVTIGGIDLPEWYTNVDGKISTISQTKTSMDNSIKELSEMDVPKLISIAKTLHPILSDGYDSSYMEVIGGSAIRIGGTYVYKYITTDDLDNTLANLNLVGTPPNIDSMSLLKSNVDSLDMDIDSLPSMPSELGGDIAKILDGMCMVKSMISPTIIDTLSLRSLL